MDYLENRTFEEIQLGESASLTRTLTEKDIQVFAIMSGDINPAHVDIEYAQSEMFHGIIGHGMWGAALISTVLGTQLPGPGTIYISQTLRFKKPVTIGDSLTVTISVLEKKPEKHRVIFLCVCKNQRQDIVIEGQAEVIAPIKKIRRPKTVLPTIALRRPHSLFDEFLTRAKSLGSLRTAVIYPVREKVIEAVDAAKKAGLINPILIGPKEHILHTAQLANINISDYDIVDVEQHLVAIQRAVTLAREHDVNAIVRGGVTRNELLHAIQKQDKGLMSERHLSYAAVADVPTYPKALILTDILVNIEPNLEIKRGITQNAIDFAKALDIKAPKVAIVAGVDTVNSHMRSTVDAAALCKMAERGQIHGGILDGPLTFDNVISAEVGKAKGIHSSIMGDADILVMPNLETGTILVKQLEYLAESRNAGLLLGARVPVLMSHIHDIYLSNVSCALAILEYHYQKREREL